MNSTVARAAATATAHSSFDVPAEYYLAAAAFFGACTVLVPKRSHVAYGTFVLMAASVYGFTTASTGSDFGLAMGLAGYIFHVLAIRLICDCRKPLANSDRQPKTQWEWFVVAITNPRRVGWDGPTGQQQSRVRFVLRHIRDLAFGLLALDLCHAYFTTSSWYMHDAPVDGVRIQSLPVVEQAVHTAVWVVYAYLLWFLPYQGLAITTVTCGVTQPNEWPPLFAGLSEATSVSKLWGHVWHQTHRQTFMDLSDALLRHLYDPATSRSRRAPSAQYIKAAIAFGVSAIVHAAGSLALPPDPRTGTRGCAKPAIFFALQFAGVALERWLSRTTSVRPPRSAGHLWLAMWGISTLILSGWMDDLVGRRSIPLGVESMFLKVLRS